MTMTIRFEIPKTSDLSELDTKMILAGELYSRGKLSLGQAAKSVGIAKREFIESIGKYGYSIFSDKEEDLLNDIENA